MMSGQTTEKQKTSSFYLSKKGPFTINAMQVIPNTNLIAYIRICTNTIFFRTYDEKGINSVCSSITLPKNYSPRSLCISPEGYLICSALVYPKGYPAFLTFDISAGIENAKQIECVIPYHYSTLESTMVVALGNTSLACTCLDSSFLHFLSKSGVQKSHNMGRGLFIKSLILLPTKELLVICNDAIIFLNLDDCENKKIILSRDALGIKGIFSGTLINTGELVLTYQEKGLGQKILFCDLDLTNRTLKATRVIDLGSEEITMFNMKQTTNHQFVCLTSDFDLALSQYDVTFHLKKVDIKTELNRVLSNDTAGVVLSYLHTASLFKPAPKLPLCEMKTEETSKPSPSA